MKKHGGIRQGQGRKPLAEGEKTVKVNLTITESQRGQLLALGGSAWLRSQLENLKYKQMPKDGNHKDDEEH